MRILYRTWQFWKTLNAAPLAGDLAEAQKYLTPTQLDLFRRMQRSEQAHALRIFHQLLEAGETHPDLLTAALLHDAGKSRFPLRAWERVLVVLGKAAFPARARQWGQGSPRGWRRPFVVAEQHAAWGAELAAQAGATPLAAAIIQRHQEKLSEARHTLEDRLLRQLQLLDDKN